MFYTTDLALWNMYLREELISCLEEQYKTIFKGDTVIKDNLLDINVSYMDEIQQIIVLDIKKSMNGIVGVLNCATKQALDEMYDYLVEHEVPSTKALLVSESVYSFHKWLGFYNFDLARLIKDNQGGIATEPKSKKKVVGNLKQKPKTVIKDGKVNCKWEVHIIREV